MAGSVELARARLVSELLLPPTTYQAATPPATSNSNRPTMMNRPDFFEGGFAADLFGVTLREGTVLPLGAAGFFDVPCAEGLTAEGLAGALVGTAWPHFLHLIDLPAMLSGSLYELRHLAQVRERAMRCDSGHG